MGGGVFDLHLGEIAFQLFRQDHRHRGQDALAHVGLGDAQRDGIVGVDDDARVLRVEADHRLVNHKHLRVMQQRGDDGDALARAMRKAFQREIHEFGEMEPRNQLVRAGFNLRVGRLEKLADEAEKFPWQ